VSQYVVCRCPLLAEGETRTGLAAGAPRPFGSTRSFSSTSVFIMFMTGYFFNSRNNSGISIKQQPLWPVT
jgi:predicted secreted protein